MMTQRRLDEIKVTAKFRVNRMLARFYESYYGPMAMMAAAQQQQQPQQPPQPQIQPPPMMGGPNG